jgi:hypothetical protein
MYPQYVIYVYPYISFWYMRSDSGYCPLCNQPKNPKRTDSMKKFIYNNYLENYNSNFELPEEPQLNRLIGFDCCESCYFRESTLKRIQDGIRQLRGGA